jgi:hypothetical protein
MKPRTRQEVLDDLRSVFEYKGNPVTTFGVNTPTAGPGLGVQWGPIASFPFRTKAAEAIWAKVPEIIKLNPDQSIDEIIRLATIDAEVFTYELADEDIKLLELAVAWSKSQRPRKSADSGGSPPKTTV